jgi:peptidyl-prolyl cis-trans isomerase D
VEQATQTELQQRDPQSASNPAVVQYFEQQVGQQLVQQQVLLQEAHKLGIRTTDADVRKLLQTGPPSEALYPNGKYIGDAAYRELIDNRLHESVTDFEDQIKEEITVQRLQAFVTSGVTVSDQEVREVYRKQNIKIKFDYASISPKDVRNTINPSDSDLEAFFKKNAERYAQAVPGRCTITYFAFTANQVPGGVAQPSQQQVQQYYNEHLSDYAVPDQAKSRHILIGVPENADAKTDAAAKAKAEMILQQLRSGGSWTALAKKYSEDPGSKDNGGELGFAERGKMVPAFDTAIFTQKIGDVEIVKSNFGYHIVQVEERDTAHTKPLNEVLPEIQAELTRDSTAQAQANYAQQLTAEAVKNGLQKTAAAHHLNLVTTPPVAYNGVISALPDSSQLLAKAFKAKQGDAPQSAPTGEGYAIFQVADVVPPHAPTFAEWKTQVLADFRGDLLHAQLVRKTKEFADEARAMNNDLAKAAKAVGATIQTSDLVDPTGQVPGIGEVGRIAPQLFEMNVGQISDPIFAEQSGVVVKILDRQEPTADEIAQNMDQTRDQLLEQRRKEAFGVFMSGVWNDYKKHNLIRLNATAQNPQAPAM